jgi:hypothetical protein
MINKQQLKKKELINSNNTNVHGITGSQGDVKIYSQSEKYKVGQKIYHPKIDDKGIVTKVKRNSGTVEKVCVKFENAGEKLLVQGVKNEPSK